MKCVLHPEGEILLFQWTISKRVELFYLGPRHNDVDRPSPLPVRGGLEANPGAHR